MSDDYVSVPHVVVAPATGSNLAASASGKLRLAQILKGPQKIAILRGSLPASKANLHRVLRCQGEHARKHRIIHATVASG